MNIRLDYPPSINHYWRHNRGAHHISAEGKAYRASVINQVTVASPYTGRLGVQLELFMPDRRDRDIDNVCKAVLDSLQHAGVYESDCQIDELIVKRLGVDPPGCVDVTVEQLKEG